MAQISVSYLYMRRLFLKANNDLVDEVLELIHLKSEGGYWDFKRSWHKNDGELLHDIICMANNLENRDAFIIFGIDEENDFAMFSLVNDENRRNNNEITTFLREKKFQGTIRPDVRVETVEIDNNEIDVLVIKNSNHTPYVLTEDYPNSKDNRRARKLCVYTRVNDTNTPIDRNADMDKIEYLWRKRFGIHLSTIDKLNLYLGNIDSWIYSDVRSSFYYQYDPLFTIHIEEKDTLDRREEFYNKLFINSTRFDWQQYNIKYNGIIIHDGWASYNDGGNILIANPQKGIVKIDHSKIFSFYYYVQSDIQGMLNNIFLKYYLDDTRETFRRIKDCIIEFQDEEEMKSFENNLQLIISSGKENTINYPNYVLSGSLNLSAHENEEYINAKKAKYIFHNL